MTNESERAKFEAWYEKEYEISCGAEFPLAKNADGTYRGPAVRQASWAAWLTRAQSSGPVVAVSELQELVDVAKRPFHDPDEYSRGYKFGYRAAMNRLDKLIAKNTGRE